MSVSAGPEPRRIAIFRMGHIGDTIVAMPAFWTVRRRFPDAHILYLTQENRAGTIAQGTEVLRPGIVYDDVFTYRLGADGVSKWHILKTLANLRRRRIDLLVYLAASRTPGQLDRDEKFFRLAGVRRIVGIQGHRETDYQPSGSPLPSVTNEAEILLRHLARDGINAPDDPKRLTHIGLSDEERQGAAEWLASEGVDPEGLVIALCPGSKMPAKRWDIDRYCEVVRAIDREFRPTFLVFGGPAEIEDCRRMAEVATNAVIAAGRLSVRQSTAVLEHCRLYLGNDTGTMHLAASAGVPCVAVFSARDWPGRWYPFGVPSVIHREVVPCEGCMLEICDKNNLCLDLISAERVLNSVRAQLSDSEAAGKPSSGGSERVTG